MADIDDRVDQPGYTMTKADHYVNGESSRYGVSMPTPPKHSKTRGMVLPNIAVKETPIHLDQHTQAPAALSIVKGGVTKYFTNRFYLTGVQEAREEKAQIIETFGVPSYSFFGEKTRIYNFSGQLLEAKSQKPSKFRHKYLWSSSFLDLYENHLRGSKLASNDYEAVLTFKNTRLCGFVINVNIMHNANNPMLAQFSFSMIVRKQEYIGRGGGTADGSVIQSLYSVDSWIKSDALVKQLTSWNSDLIFNEANELNLRKEVTKRVQKDFAKAVKAGEVDDRTRKYWKIDSIDDLVREWAETQVASGYDGFGEGNDFKGVNFADLTSADPVVVKTEALRVHQMVQSVGDEFNYGHVFKSIISTPLPATLNSSGQKVSIGQQIKALPGQVVTALGQKLQDGWNGLSFAALWLAWDLGESWLTSITRVYLYAAIIDGIIATGPYAARNDMMT